MPSVTIIDNSFSLSSLIGRPEHASLYLATESQIRDLEALVSPFNVKGCFHNWRLITLQIHVPDGLQESATYITGSRSRVPGRATVSSAIKAIDFERGYIRTAHSVYGIDMTTRGVGEPPIEHLATIASGLWSWGFGIALGVPVFEVA